MVEGVQEPSSRVACQEEPSIANDLEGWLDAVASGRADMSQRGVRWVEAQGGLDLVVAAAKHRGVHLVRLTDDEGKVLIAASLHWRCPACDARSERLALPSPFYEAPSNSAQIGSATTTWLALDHAPPGLTEAV